MATIKNDKVKKTKQTTTASKTVARKSSVKAKGKPVKDSDKLVTNIVDVKNVAASKKAAPKNGVMKMTKASDKKAKETVETANSFFADMREKATVAAEKGRELFAETGSFTKENLTAVTESGKIAAKGTQELAKENLAYAKANFSETQKAVKSLAAVKSPTEFVQVQTEIARKGFDTLVSQGSKNSEDMIKLASDIFQPLSNRMAVAADFFKKAA